MESTFWAIVVYVYVIAVLAVVGFGAVRLFGGFHRTADGTSYRVASRHPRPSPWAGSSARRDSTRSAPGRDPDRHGHRDHSEGDEPSR